MYITVCLSVRPFNRPLPLCSPNNVLCLFEKLMNEIARNKKQKKNKQLKSYLKSLYEYWTTTLGFSE